MRCICDLAGDCLVWSAFGEGLVDFSDAAFCFLDFGFGLDVPLAFGEFFASHGLPPMENVWLPESW